MKFNNLDELRNALFEVVATNTDTSIREEIRNTEIEDYFCKKRMLLYKKYKVQSSQSDNKNKAHLSSIFSFFEAIAGEHSELIDMNYSDMRNKNQTWILNRIALDIKYLPNKYDDITIYTWQSKQSSVGFYREYLVLNKNNEAIISSKSFWSIMDLDSRVIIPSNEIVKIKENPYIIPIKTTNAKLKSIKAAFPEEDEQKINYKHLIGFSDLDSNNHVNNTRYINMIINAVDFLNLGLDIDSFEVNYTSELLKGDLVSIDAAIITETNDYYDIAVRIKFLENLIRSASVQETTASEAFDTITTEPILESKRNIKLREPHDSLKALIKLRK